MKKLARNYLLALRAFTRIPVGGGLAQWAGIGEPTAAVSAAHLPGVGLLVGMAASVVFALVSLLLPEAPFAPLAAAAACTMATALLTGAADEDRLAATWGPVALVLALAMKLALLAVIAALSPAAVLAALVGAHAVSRFWPLVAQVERAALRAGAAWCVVPLLLMLAAGRVAFPLFALAVSAAAWWVLRRRGGLAALQQGTELAFYLGAAIGGGIGIGVGR